MQALLFERPLVLVGVWLVAQFVVVLVWARRRTSRASLAAILVLLSLPLLLGLQALVITDRERITAICVEMADAVDAGEIARVGAHVGPAFAAGEMGRDEMLKALEGALTRVKVEEPRLNDFEVTTDGDRGRATFAANCRLVLQDSIQSGMLSRWELGFQWVGEQWLVIEIKPVPTPWFPYRSLGDVVRASGR